MAYKKPEEYKSQSAAKYPYPSDNLDPKLKQESKYFQAVCEAFYSDYINNRCAVPYEFGQNRSIAELRQYAKGRQSSDKIKSWVLGKRKKQADGTYITKMNISWETYAKLPQMFDIMRSKNMSQEYEVGLTCIDEKSIAAIDSTRAMMKFLLEENTKSFLEKASFKPNLEPDPQKLGLQNDEDVDMYIETGGFTLQWQIGAIAACNKSKLVSDYKRFQDAIFDDLIINPEGICGAKSYIERSTKLPKFRRVNMERVILPYSELNDFSDITRAAELRVMSIADIRKENPELTSAQLMTIAKNFSWMNPGYEKLIAADGWYGPYRENWDQAYDVDPVSRVKVLVMDAQWLSVDMETNIKNQRGFYSPVDYDYRLTAKDSKNGDRLIKKNVIKKYEAQWIVGTEVFLSHGVCKDTVYYGEDGNKTPRLDYFFAKTGNMSLVERCVAIVDDMDMIMVKHRNAWATLPAAPAMAIQKDLIENVFLNGILQQPEDIMQALVERGILYYNGLDDHGKPLYMAGGQKPIDYMDVSKMTQMLSVCSAELALKVGELREVLGLSGGADGGDIDRYQGLGTTELAFQASNASLQPTFNAYNYMFVALFTDIIKKWQITARDKPIKVSYALLGSQNLKMLELAGDFTNAEFNVKVQIAPSSEERAKILADLIQMKQAGTATGGAQGITTAQYLYLYEKVMGGNLKEAYFVMAKIEAKQRQEAADAKRQDQEANIISQQESARVKGEMDMQSIQEKGRQQNDNTIIAALLKQVQAMQEALVKPTTEGQSNQNQGFALATIDQNTQDVAEIVMNTQEQQMPLEPEQMAQEEQMAIQ